MSAFKQFIKANDSAITGTSSPYAYKLKPKKYLVKKIPGKRIKKKVEVQP